MKKIYTKPSLHAERFAVEGIMSENVAEALSSITELYLGTNAVAVEFNSTNTLESVNYSDFIG